MIEATVFVQGEERDIMGALRTYVRDEFTDKRQQEVDTSAWPISCAARQPCPLGPNPHSQPPHSAGDEYIGLAHVVRGPAALPLGAL